MIVYAVMFDDYDSTWPEGIFDDLEAAIALAKQRAEEHKQDYEVIRYELNKPFDSAYKHQKVFATRKIQWK